MKLTAKLTVIILTIVMFFGMVLTTFVYRANLKTLEKDITDRFKDMTFHIMDKIDRSLYERYSNIQIIASDPIVSARTSTPEQITKRLIEYRNTFKTYSSLSFFDLNRIRIADISRLNIGKQHPMVGYWEDVLAGKISAASDIRVAEELHAPVIYFAAPVKDRSGHPFGVVVARVPVTRLYEITKKAGVIQEAEDLEIDLLDKQGLLLYSSHNKRGIFKDNLSGWEAAKRSLAGEKTGSLIGFHDGTEDIFVFVHEQGHLDFRGNDWTLLMHLPTKIAFASAVELRNKVIAVGIPITFLVVIIIIIVSRRFIRPIAKLKDAAIEIGQGKLNAKVEIKSKDEIGFLAVSFNKMIENLRKTMVSKDYLDDIIKSMNDSLIVTDPDGKIKMLNKATLGVLGYAEDDLLNQPIGKIIEEGLIFKETGLNELIKKGFVGNVEKTYLGKDGRKIPVLFSGQIMRDRDDKTKGFVFMARDITERKRSEDELYKEEQKVRLLLDSTVEGIYGVDLQGNCMFTNPSCLKILGYNNINQLMGSNLHSLIHHTHKDGTPYPVEECRIYQAFRDGKETHVDDEVFWHYDGHSFPVEYRSNPMWQDGKTVGTVVTFVDITERKQVEVEHQKMEEKLRETQKLESLGVLAGGIAHDFNNILTGILGNSDLAFDDLAPASPVRNYIEKIQEEAKRAAELCHLMLAYSGKGKFVIENIDVNEIIKEVTHMLEVSISKKHDIKNDLTENLPSVDADITQIRQVIMNLVINASEAVGENNGVISLSTTTVDCGSEGCQTCKGMELDEALPVGQYVVIEVTDTGVGMDKATIDKIFDPFFTTKFTGRGLGMSAVLGIIRGHKGAINVESEPGKGTKFTVLLPASTVSSTAKLDSEKTEAPWQGSGTVLVVDDEETVRGVTKSMLGKIGFNIVTADDGKEAVEILRERSNEIDGVILDLTMPRMSGKECFLELRKIRKDIPIVICSGYSEEETTQKFVDQGVNEFLQKPFHLKTLKNKMRKVFEKDRV